MTVNTASSIAEIKLDMMELKLDRLIDEMRLLKSRTIAFDTRLRGIEAYLKPNEPSEQQPKANRRDGKDSFVCGRGSDRCGLDQALSGNMTRALTAFHWRSFIYGPAQAGIQQ
jgi:hypothetical protein